MTVELAILFALSIACDVLGQLAFKFGTKNLPEAGVSGLHVFVARLLREPWILAGLGVYAVEFVVWVRILAIAPLNIAFPVASLNILGIVFAGRVFLGETVNLRQWAGAALITVGVAVVAQTI